MSELDQTRNLCSKVDHFSLAATKNSKTLTFSYI